MAKQFLSVGVPTFGTFVSASGSHVALRVGDTSAMPPTSSIPRASCATCDLSRIPWFGETTTRNPQPQPPRMYGDGRMLRR